MEEKPFTPRFQRMAASAFLILTSTGAPAADPPMEEVRINPWQQFYNVRAAAGYKDNVLLSRFVRQESPFFMSEVDAALVRIPQSEQELEMTLFMTGRDVRYFGPGIADKDQSLIAVTTLRKPLNDLWELGFEAQYAYFDQVFDVSASIVDLGNIKSQLHTGSTEPSIRRHLGHGSYLELGTRVTRNEFLAPADDDWEIGPRLTFGHEYGHRSEWNLNYVWVRREADATPESDITGAPIPGTTLVRNEHQAEIELRHYWNEARTWRTVTKLEARAFLHTGSSFHDYLRYQASQELRYRKRPWEFKARAKFRLYDYDTQAAAPGNPEIRKRAQLNVEFRAERYLTRQLKVFTFYELELSDSNRISNDYTASVFYAGIDWEF